RVGATPAQRRNRAVDAGGALVLEGCRGLHAVSSSLLAGGHLLARLADVVALLVLNGRVGADDRRARQRLRTLLTLLGIQHPRGEAAVLDGAQRRPVGARSGD